MTTERYLNIEYTFERRRYGTGASIKFFTWLNYRVNGEWKSYGDPWPKSRLNRRELNEALARIIYLETKTGTRVHTVLGDGVITGKDGKYLRVALEGHKADLPLAASSIIEVQS